MSQGWGILQKMFGEERNWISQPQFSVVLHWVQVLARFPPSKTNGALLRSNPAVSCVILLSQIEGDRFVGAGGVSIVVGVGVSTKLRTDRQQTVTLIESER